MPRVEPTLLASQIRRIASEEALTDVELAGRYAEHRDAAAFEVLVWRHGPMVWATCRRVLRHHQDVEDAFQATFLALARAAGTLGSRHAVAGWLHRVAMNAALNMKKAHRRSSRLTDDVSAPPATDSELPGVVDEELERLPNRMRAAFVLCCIEGMSSAEAARELGCPVGTVDTRIHAARVRLRDRLTRRGLGPTAILVGATWPAPNATATLPSPWVRTALHYTTVPADVPNTINLLTTGVLKSMSASKLKSIATLLVVSGVLLIGCGISVAHLIGRPEGAADGTNAPKASPMVAEPVPINPTEEWSKPVNGLQARVALVEKAKINGTRMLHPYLELRNTDTTAYPLKVRLGGGRHVRFELVDADGKVVDDGQKGALDGAYPDPGTVSLPLDSSLRVGMSCTNWGTPKDAAAMIATDSGAWVLKPEQEGKVYLRVKVSGKKQDEDRRVWFGNLEAQVKVTWSVEARREQSSVQGTKLTRASKVLDAMEGFRVEIPRDTRPELPGNGLTVKGLEPYTLHHLAWVAEGLGVQTQKECLMLLTYLKDTDHKLRFIAAHAINKATGAYPNGMSVECFSDTSSEGHRKMLLRFLEVIEKLPD